MARPGGRIDDLNIQQRFLRFPTLLAAQPVGHHRLQRRVQQAVDEAGGRVVAAGLLALAAGGGPEVKRGGDDVQLGMQLQQRLVDAAQLLRTQVLIIDGAQDAILYGES